MSLLIPTSRVLHYLIVCRECEDYPTEAERVFVWSAGRKPASLTKPERRELQRIAFHQAYKKFERQGKEGSYYVRVCQGLIEC